MELLLTLADALFVYVITPLFRGAGEGLAWLVLKPLALLHAPTWAQVVIVAGGTVAVSRFIRRLLRVEEKEAAYRRAFAEKKAQQAPLASLPDWKVRDALYRASDQEIDEGFNEYLAMRFAWYGLMHLLPIFLTLFWLERYLAPVLPAENMVVVFSGNSGEVRGLSVPAVFLAVYLCGQAVASWAGRRRFFARSTERFWRLCTR